MRRTLTAALSALILTACAAGYDKTALPGASVAVHQAYEDCSARWAAKTIKTYAEMASCSLAAERGFFTAIKLQKMDRFEAYAASYQTLAADRDAHRISDQQADRRAGKMLGDFLAACRCKKERMQGAFGFPDSPRSLGP